jgi:hypothetical protein
MRMTVAAAIDRARALRGGGDARAPAPADARRVVAIGDPQTSAERFFGALAAHDLLDAGGWLRPDARLISMGDHFDYHVPERDRARVEGVLILGWLAAHDRDHAPILFGNHDAARVMELVSVDDARFALAAERARELLAASRSARPELDAKFRRDFPDIATPGYAARDYNAFTVEQRHLVQRLLLDRRYDLALARSAADGTPLLLTHAGVVMTQLVQLGLRDERSPTTIASALNARLAAAVAEIADAWRTREPTPLSLEPLHVQGAHGQEGGGLLYQRPSDPERPGADPRWELAPRSPRRFDPRELPRGLVQVVGHTGHRKAWKELPRWRAHDLDEDPGGVRTLRVTTAGSITYQRGIHRGDPDDAIVWMIDPEMHYVPAAEDVAVLDLAV